MTQLPHNSEGLDDREKYRRINDVCWSENDKKWANSAKKAIFIKFIDYFIHTRIRGTIQVRIKKIVSKCY